MRMARPIFAVLVLLVLFTAPALGQDRPPNIVIVFIDDMGYADIGPFGAEGYETPNLDKMAEEGRVFTDFYVTQAICSASRAALLTGCYNVRVGVTGVFYPKDNFGLNPDETTIAEIVKQKGYATACYGKWHLGNQPKFLPTNQGFDEFLGLPYSSDMWPEKPELANQPLAQRLRQWPYLPLYEGAQIIDTQVTPEDQTQLTTMYTERSVKFIHEHKEQPFLLYVPHSMVHVPLFVSEKFAGKSERGLFGDVVMELDWSMGEIFAALREDGLAENTLVIFTADNGPWLSYGSHAGSAKPFSEGKHTSFEGGVREPTIMWWPGKIPAGTKTTEMAMTIDILPTIAALVGAELPDKKIDGKNIWPLISGEPGATSGHEAFYFYYDGRLEAIRSGKWKLHFPHSYESFTGRTGRDDGYPTPAGRGRINQSLFDLDADPGEWTDVSAANPEVVARLLELAEAMRAELGDGRQRPGAGVRPLGYLEPGDARFELVNGEFQPLEEK